MPANQILYVFRGSAARSGLIDAPWTRTLHFDPEGVYVRTVKGVFETNRNTEDGLNSVLPERWRARIRRSIIANAQCAGLDISNRVSIHVGKDIEYLTASRGNFRDLMYRYGLCPKHFR
jgi:hypothetical protein